MNVDSASDSLEVLMQFLYIAPVGLLQFQLDGPVDLVDPLAARLLMPLNPAGSTRTSLLIRCNPGVRANAPSVATAS